MRSHFWMMGAGIMAMAAAAAHAQQTPALPEVPAPPGSSAPMPEPAPAPPSMPDGEVAPAPAAAAIATDPSQTITANVVAADGLSTLESAVVAAELAETLGGAGPFTVFAPTNAAFAAVPSDALQSLLQPANRAQLQAVLRAHVVEGRVTAADLAQQIEAGGGSATIRTVGGGTLNAMREGGNIVLMGGNGTRAVVSAADAGASNGVIHVIDGVLLPSG